MGSSETFSAIRAEYQAKKAAMGEDEYQAMVDRENHQFEATRGQQAYADTGREQMKAIDGLREQVRQREAQVERGRLGAVLAALMRCV